MNHLRRVRLPIKTPRLLLQLPSLRDVPTLVKSFRDPRTARAAGAYLHSSAERKDPARMVKRTLREYRASEHLSLSVALRGTDACIGRVGLRGVDWTWRKVESLSYWIAPEHWNHGYATEAPWFLCRAAFRDLGMRRITSSALEPNVASQAVMRRLGFVREGRERRSVRVGHTSMDMLLYGLLREELPSWTVVQGQLEHPTRSKAGRVRSRCAKLTRGPRAP